MNLAFLATGDFAVPALRALLRAGHSVALSVSQPDRPAGRGRQTVPTAVHAAADQLGIPHAQVENINTPEFAAQLAATDLAVVAAFGQKLGPDILAAPRHGCVNIHGSLLPRYRGAAPYQWAIINGDAETGVTIFQINQKWDAGAIWARRATPIGETETADELHDRLALLGAELIVETVSQIERGTATPQPQNAAEATRAPKLSKSDGRIDWSQPARVVARRINGLWSWPAATATFALGSGRTEVVQLARAKVIDESSPPGSAPPGSFLADRSTQSGSGRIVLLEVKPAGGKLMSFEAFANGRRIAPPDRME
ncbi:Methionyl-tRNA formyltransferase [Phycisphaerae bacterium RAS1]|nr:Methionyl-tRNA formyltransferase [Phycisphaerae bacterium RAS1]